MSERKQLNVDEWIRTEAVALAVRASDNSKWSDDPLTAVELIDMASDIAAYIRWGTEPDAADRDQAAVDE